MDLRGAQALAAQQFGALTVEQAKQFGLTPTFIRHRVDTGQWQRPMRGVILLTDSDNTLVGRCVGAMQLMQPDNAVVSHLTAARLHKLEGIPLPAPDEPIHLTLPREQTRTQRPGVRLHYSRLGVDDVTVIQGVLLTSIARTLVDLALTTDRPTAVCAAESALRQGHDLGDLRALMRGRRGSKRAARWWDDVDARAKTPIETRARLPLIDAGLAPDELQHKVVVDGGLTLEIDMAYKGARLAVETDGRDSHSDPRQFEWDRRRWILLQQAGWTVVIFTWGDVLRPFYVVQTVRRALERLDSRAV
jgi:hypothetical protein